MSTITAERPEVRIVDDDQADEERYGLTAAGVLALEVATAARVHLVAPTTGVEWGGRRWAPAR